MARAPQAGAAPADGGATMAEHIIARAAGRSRVIPGEIVTVRVDLAVLNDLSGPLAIKRLAEAGHHAVFEPDRIAFFAGRHMPFRDEALAAQVAALRDFCAAQRIRHCYADGEGMDHALLPEYGLLRPGDLVCDGDSHACTAGAVGALAVPMGSTDMAYILATGETWLKVPTTIRIVYEGTAGRYVTSKDLALATMARLGTDGARYRAIEFHGPALAALSVDERFTIANMAIEMGAKTALMVPDHAVLSYLAARGVDAAGGVAAILPDADAGYERSLAIDVATLRPLVARPHSPADVVPAAEIRSARVTQVNIGSCTNGRMVDLRQAAAALRGRRVARGVRLMVTPATDIVWRQAMAEGVLAVLAEAGATINPPGCGACAGWHMGVLGPEDVCVATHNRNFRGRMGHRDARIYLASPYVAAAAAVAGELVDPAAVFG